MRKFLFSCFFWFVLFSVLGSTPDFSKTCPECRPYVEILYQDVLNAITTFNTINGVVQGNFYDSSHSGLLDSGNGLVIASQALNSHNIQNNLEGYIQRNGEYQGRLDTAFTVYSNERSNLNNILSTMKTRLLEFECNCTSNCSCVPLLTSISNSVDFIFSTLDDQYTFISNRLTKIDDFMYDDIAKLVDDYEVTWSSSFTNRAFSWGLLSKWLFRDNDEGSAWHLFQQQFDESLSNHPETGLSNEGFVGLRQLDTLQKMMYINAGIAQMFADYNSESNTNDTDLSAITNYLYKVQKPFYENYNSMFSSQKVPSPFIQGRYSFVTNFFQKPSALSYIRLFSNDGKSLGYTNFFSRVELYLMALNGLFSDDEIIPDDEFASIYSESQIDHNLDNATNNLSAFATDSASLTNYINTSWTEGITAIFEKMKDTTVFEGDTGDGRYITFIPSFNLGGVQIEHLDFDMETIRPVIDFSNAAFKCIWAGIYLVVFFGFIWFAGSRIFRVMLWIVHFISGSLGN